MKSIFIFLTICLSITYAKGQQKNIFKNKPWEDFKKRETLAGKLKHIDILSNNRFIQPAPQIAEDPSVVKIPLTYHYMGSTGKGLDIYTMNPDKMICIAPDKTFISNMPVAGLDELSTTKLLSPQKRTEEK